MILHMREATKMCSLRSTRTTNLDPARTPGSLGRVGRENEVITHLGSGTSNPPKTSVRFGNILCTLSHDV